MTEISILLQCQEIKQQADDMHPGMVNVYETPADLMQNSDIIFSCVPDPRAAKEVSNNNLQTKTILSEIKYRVDN